MTLAGCIPMTPLTRQRGRGNSRVHALRTGLAVRRPGLGREHRAADRTGWLIAQDGRAEQRDDYGKQDGRRGRTPTAHEPNGMHRAVL